MFLMVNNSNNPNISFGNMQADVTKLGPRGKEIAGKIFSHPEINSLHESGLNFDFISKKGNKLVCNLSTITYKDYIMGSVKKRFGFFIQKKNIEKHVEKYVNKIKEEASAIWERMAGD
ncbi:MAG: hypothetical protein WCY19_02325 [Candidatus Gastranaerophilaceae bacterium]